MVKYFGTDGVRGIANKELTPELAFKLGRYGGYVLAHNEGADRPKVLVGRDTRVSGEMLECALISGLASMGEVMKGGCFNICTMGSCNGFKLSAQEEKLKHY